MLLQLYTRAQAVWAAGEGANLFVDIFAGKLKCAGETPQRSDGFIRKVLLELLFDREVRLE